MSALAHDEIYVLTIVGPSDARFSLFNIYGQSIEQGELKNGKIELNISDLPAGTYILYFQSTFGELQRKLLIR